MKWLWALFTLIPGIVWAQSNTTSINVLTTSWVAARQGPAEIMATSDHVQYGFGSTTPTLGPGLGFNLNKGQPVVVPTAGWIWVRLEPGGRPSVLIMAPIILDEPPVPPAESK